MEKELITYDITKNLDKSELIFIICSSFTYSGYSKKNAFSKLYSSFYLVANTDMKIYKSLKSAKNRDKNCKIVRRKGCLIVINKINPRFKAKQG